MVQRIFPFALLATTTLGVAVLGAPADARADDACAAAPAAPKGHVLARIDKAEGNGAVTARLVGDVPSRQRPKAGDEAYLLTCTGARVGGAGDTTVRAASGSSVDLVIGMPPSQLVGKYLAIDSGFDSEPPLQEGEVRPPAGYAKARILDVRVEGGGVRVVISRGPGQGVMPGARAYMVTAKGQPANRGAFTVQHAQSARASAAFIARATPDSIRESPDVFVEVGKPCQAPSPVDLSGAELFAAAKGSVPAGWAVLPVPRDRSGWPGFRVAKGAKDGVLPQKAWMLVGVGATSSYVPAHVSDVTLSEAKVTIDAQNPDALKNVELRVLVNASATCPAR